MIVRVWTINSSCISIEELLSSLVRELQVDSDKNSAIRSSNFNVGKWTYRPVICFCGILSMSIDRREWCEGNGVCIKIVQKGFICGIAANTIKSGKCVWRSIMMEIDFEPTLRPSRQQ